MSSDTVLEIEDSFTIRGRGLILIPKAFLFVTPKGVPKPFSNSIAIIRPDGIREHVEAQFQIEHFSLVSENGGLYGRFSLILLLPGKSKEDMPIGSQICISEAISSSMKNMIKWS